MSRCDLESVGRANTTRAIVLHGQNDTERRAVHGLQKILLGILVHSVHSCYNFPDLTIEGRLLTAL